MFTSSANLSLAELYQEHNIPEFNLLTLRQMSLDKLNILEQNLKLISTPQEDDSSTHAEYLKNVIDIKKSLERDIADPRKSDFRKTFTELKKRTLDAIEQQEIFEGPNTISRDTYQIEHNDMMDAIKYKNKFWANNYEQMIKPKLKNFMANCTHHEEKVIHYTKSAQKQIKEFLRLAAIDIKQLADLNEEKTSLIILNNSFMDLCYREQRILSDALYPQLAKITGLHQRVKNLLQDTQTFTTKLTHAKNSRKMNVAFNKIKCLPEYMKNDKRNELTKITAMQNPNKLSSALDSYLTQLNAQLEECKQISSMPRSLTSLPQYTPAPRPMEPLELAPPQKADSNRSRFFNIFPKIKGAQNKNQTAGRRYSR